MNDAGFIVTYVALIVTGVVSAFARDRFFKTLEQRQPGAALADVEVAEQIRGRPSQLPLIVLRATRLRLSALSRKWPYAEVERHRKLALVSIAVTVVKFGWLLLRAVG
jgi:hypothetical protein